MGNNQLKLQINNPYCYVMAFVVYCMNAVLVILRKWNRRFQSQYQYNSFIYFYFFDDDVVVVVVVFVVVVVNIVVDTHRIYSEAISKHT